MLQIATRLALCARPIWGLLRAGSLQVAGTMVREMSVATCASSERGSVLGSRRVGCSGGHGAAAIDASSIASIAVLCGMGMSMHAVRWGQISCSLATCVACVSLGLQVVLY